MPQATPQTKQEISDRFARHVSSGKAEFYSQAGVDFIMGKREGVYIWDLDGRRLINCHSNGGVFNLGHRNPRILQALQHALTELDIGNHHFISGARASLAERLASLSPGDVNRVVFGVSGGEAVDMAIKLARGHTQRSIIVSALGGYHGHTGLALQAGDAQYREPFGEPFPDFVQVPFGDLEALEASVDGDTAAVLFETIPATLGIVLPPEDFYAGVRELCDRTGAIMIMDEVQTGLGRCGEVWGIETYDVVPDILVTGKGLSGGLYPLTATIYRDHLNPILHRHPFVHLSTFGGSEVGCHVSMEVLNILEEPGFLENVQSRAAQFHAGFSRLMEAHPGVLTEFRQRGLMMGMKLADENLGLLVSQLGFRFGALLVYANHDPSVVQVLPPLIINEQEVTEVLQVLEAILSEVEALIRERQN